MKKFYMSRKFWAMVIGVILIWSAYYVTLPKLEARHIVVILPICVSVTVLLLMGFIGGTVWKDYVKSKFFNEALNKK